MKTRQCGEYSFTLNLRHIPTSLLERYFTQAT